MAGYIEGRPPIAVKIASDAPHNVFYAGQAVTLRVLDKGATRYEVRNYNGDLVDSGAVAGDTIAPKVTALGWFKLYLFGADTGGVWRDAVGSTTFCIFRKDTRFPEFPDPLYQKLLVTQAGALPALHTSDAPLSGVPTSNYAVHYCGQITPQYSENYTFTTVADAGARLWVNGQLLIDDWKRGGRNSNSATMALVAGQKYDFKLDYKQRGYESYLDVRWSSACQSEQALPLSNASGQFYSSDFYQSGDGSHDDVLHGVIGAGLQRMRAWDSDGGESLDAAIARLAHDIAICKELNVPVLIAFSDGTTTRKDGAALSDADRAAQMDKVRAIVTRFKDDVKVWEGRNEPNGGNSAPTGAAFAANEAKPFYDLVKSIDASAKIIGPGTVEIGARDGSLQWIEDFLKAGGGKSMDAFSFHAYNSVNGDAALASRSMAALNVVLAKYGADKLEKWQTEQGHYAAMFGVYAPRHQGRWTMLQKMLYAQQGIPKEHDHLWYDKSHGFWDIPAFIENDDGSLNPGAPLMRVWSEELFGTTFYRVLDFGAAGNNLLLGNIFQGKDKTVAAMMSTGALNVPVTLQFSNNNPVKVVTAWGESSTQTPIGTRLTVQVSELPVYVEMMSGQTIGAVPFVWGVNLAKGAQFSYTSGSPIAPYGDTDNAPAKLGNGVLETWYLDGSERPWISNQTEISEAKPVNIEVQLAGVQTVNRAVVYGCVPHSWQGSLLDFELFADVNGTWKSLGRVTEPEKTVMFADALSRSSLDSFYSDRSVFSMSFAPVTTGKFKLSIYKATKGGAPNPAFDAAGGNTTGWPQATLREIELYNEASAPVAIPTPMPTPATTNTVPQSQQKRDLLALIAQLSKVAAQMK